MTTGSSDNKHIVDVTTVFMKNPKVTNNQLKSKIARRVYSSISEKHPTFPFSINSFGPTAVVEMKMGVRECVQKSLLVPYPMLLEKEGEVVAHLKYTVLMMASGVMKITDVPLDLTKIKTEKKIEDEEILKILSQSAGKKKKRNKKKKPTVAKDESVPAAAK
jgi:hypothetical protein